MRDLRTSAQARQRRSAPPAQERQGGESSARVLVGLGEPNPRSGPATGSTPEQQGQNPPQRCGIDRQISWSTSPSRSRGELLRLRRPVIRRGSPRMAPTDDRMTKPRRPNCGRHPRTVRLCCSDSRGAPRRAPWRLCPRSLPTDSTEDPEKLCWRRAGELFLSHDIPGMSSSFLHNWPIVPSCIRYKLPLFPSWSASPLNRIAIPHACASRNNWMGNPRLGDLALPKRRYRVGRAAVKRSQIIGRAAQDAG